MFYAVAIGRKPGVYATWPECKVQIDGWPKARYKKFASRDLAEEFISDNSGASDRPTPTPCTDLTTDVSIDSDSRDALLVEMMSIRQSLDRMTSRLNTTRCTAVSGHIQNMLISVGKIESFVRRRANSSNQSPAKRRKLTSNADGLMVDSDGFVHVYTDGACPNNGVGSSLGGIGVYFAKDHPMNISEPFMRTSSSDGQNVSEMSTTNNAAEIAAATAAVKAAKSASITRLSIRTDSNYLISALTKWMPKWQQNGFLTSSGRPVKNRTELVELHNLISANPVDGRRIEVKFFHVRGHAGDPGNEAADALAVAGARHNT